MDRFMAARSPAGASGNESPMINPADQQLTGRRLLLKVTLQTERLISHLEHFIIHRAMRIMAGGAALAQRFVLENKGAFLGRVTRDARIVHRGQLRSRTHHRITLM